MVSTMPSTVFLRFRCNTVTLGIGSTAGRDVTLDPTMDLPPTADAEATESSGPRTDPPAFVGATPDLGVLEARASYIVLIDSNESSES